MGKLGEASNPDTRTGSFDGIDALASLGNPRNVPDATSVSPLLRFEIDE